jgi:hypothetical protein
VGWWRAGAAGAWLAEGDHRLVGGGRGLLPHGRTQRPPGTWGPGRLTGDGHAAGESWPGAVGGLWSGLVVRCLPHRCPLPCARSLRLPGPAGRNGPPDRPAPTSPGRRRVCAWRPSWRAAAATLRTGRVPPRRPAPARARRAVPSSQVGKPLPVRFQPTIPARRPLAAAGTRKVPAGLPAPPRDGGARPSGWTLRFGFEPVASPSSGTLAAWPWSPRRRRAAVASRRVRLRRTMSEPARGPVATRRPAGRPGAATLRAAGVPRAALLPFPRSRQVPHASPLRFSGTGQVSSCWSVLARAAGEVAACCGVLARGGGTLPFGRVRAPPAVRVLPSRVLVPGVWDRRHGLGRLGVGCSGWALVRALGPRESLVHRCDLTGWVSLHPGLRGAANRAPTSRAVRPTARTLPGLSPARTR